MVSCHQCSTPNSLDSAFCKRCGAALPEEDLQEAQEKIAGWVKEGNAAFGEGRIEEALAIASTALESNPNYVDALVLKGLCHERQGNIPEALACAEKIVELNPDSELDKIRRNGLRAQLGGALAVPGSADRRAGIVLASAVALMIFSVSGAAIYIATQKSPAPKTTQQQPVPQSYQTAQQPTNPYPTTSAPQQNPAQTFTQRPQPTVQDSSDLGDDTNRRPELPSPYKLPIDVLPTDSHGLPPNDGSLQGGGQPKSGDQGGDPAPGPDGNPAPQNPGPTNPVPTNPQPVHTDPMAGVNIRVHRGGNSGIGGSQPFVNPVLTPNGVEALTKTGMQQFLMGDYSAAAGSLEKALKNGGDPIKLNQRLGEAYANLGRTSDAIAAYSNAVAACQRALQSGKGDRSNIEVVMKNCQDAGKVLGG